MKKLFSSPKFCFAFALFSAVVGVALAALSLVLALKGKYALLAVFLVLTTAFVYAVPFLLRRALRLRAQSPAPEEK